MSDSDGFSLDLRNAEEQMDDVVSDAEGEVVLGVLNGETPSEEWTRECLNGKVLVLAIDGDLNELAGGFAAPVKDAGGTLMHFRDFLVVTPPGVELDTDRL